MSLDDRNKQADTAFLYWQIYSPQSPIEPSLRKNVTPELITFIVNESKLPLDRYIPKSLLQKKAQGVAGKTLSVFFPDNPPFKKRDLEQLVSLVILPEYELQIDGSSEADESYNRLLRLLGQYKTPAGTRLSVWALKFLTSEAQFVALEIIQGDSYKGVYFNDLSIRDKQLLLETVAEVVTRRFMENLLPVQKKLTFEMPLHLRNAIKRRLITFLHEKFL